MPYPWPAHPRAIKCTKNTPAPIPAKSFSTNTLTLGLELEMVVAGLPAATNILEHLCALLNTLPPSLPRTSIFLEHENTAADRSRFLVMKDESIDVRLNPPASPPTSPCSTPLFPDWDGEWDNIPGAEDWGSGAETSEEDWGSSGETSEEDWSPSGTACTTPDPVAAMEVEEGEGEKGHAVEMCTPIMHTGNYTTILTAALHLLKANEKLAFNRSCGIHIHIGRGEERKWSLAQLKRIAKACAIFEPLLDTLHQAHRQVATNWMLCSTRYSAHLNYLSLPAVIAAIDNVASFRRLLRLVGRDKFVKYNFVCNASYGTVEFRQMEGTDDMERILAWAAFVVRFVAGALRTSKGRFREMAGGGLLSRELLAGFGVGGKEWRVLGGREVGAGVKVREFEAPVVVVAKKDMVVKEEKEEGWVREWVEMQKVVPEMAVEGAEWL